MDSDVLLLISIFRLHEVPKGSSVFLDCTSTMSPSGTFQARSRLAGLPRSDSRTELARFQRRIRHTPPYFTPQKRAARASAARVIRHQTRRSSLRYQDRLRPLRPASHLPGARTYGLPPSESLTGRRRNRLLDSLRAEHLSLGNQSCDLDAEVNAMATGVANVAVAGRAMRSPSGVHSPPLIHGNAVWDGGRQPRLVMRDPGSWECYWCGTRVGSSNEYCMYCER